MAKTRIRRQFVPGGAGAIRQRTIDEMEIAVDNFAGWGGAGTGIAQALGREVDIAINHNPAAIAMHQTNHPGTTHYCESVYDIDPVAVVMGRPVGLGWFSPDCTHFSGAKGGKPVEKGIRGLAWVSVKWAGLVRPRVIMLENVPEFKTWGPIDENGYPIKARAGETFVAFIACLTTGLAPDHPAWDEIREFLGPDFPHEKLEHGLGYDVEWRELRACDYGAPTIRKRLFIVMRCDGRPIVWPEPTHGDPQSEAVRSGKLKPWRTAAEIIDWSIPCPSIFERKRPLKEATLRRIAKGIMKFVVNNASPFIIPVTHHGSDRVVSLDAPFPTVTAANRGEHALITAHLDRQFTRSVGHGADEPLGTVTAGGSGKANLVTAFLAQYHSETASHEARGQTMDRPILTVDTSNRYGLVAANLVHLGHGEEAKGKKRWSHGIRDVELPLNTVTATGAPAGLVTSSLVKLYGTCAHGQPVTEPMPTVTASGLHVGEVRAFLLKYYGSNVGQAADEPLHTVTSLARFGLVTVHGEPYQIVDIGMRMLEPRELFRAQDFPDDYIIDRDYTGREYSKRDQVAGCGNAVPPAFARALVAANLPEMCEQVAA